MKVVSFLGLYERERRKVFPINFDSPRIVVRALKRFPMPLGH
jgi:hypothetical protein